jgi:hypothetical protein
MTERINMQPVRLPHGRAGLSFPFEGDWDRSQKAAMYGATRANILAWWSQFPQWLRRDQGFQCLMDCYGPMTEEAVEQKRAIRTELVRDHLRATFGGALARQYENAIDRRFASRIAGDEEVQAAILSIPNHRAVVDFGTPFGGNTALLTNSTSRTVVGTKARSQQAVRLWGFDIGFDGTTSTNGPGICELFQNTFATNAPATNSTSVTNAVVDFGRPETIQATSAKAWTTEPTVTTLVEEFFIPNYMGSGIVFNPLTKPFVLAGATGPTGGSLRITQQSGITGNATGAFKQEE